jgi:hypothetical protein
MEAEKTEMEIMSDLEKEVVQAADCYIERWRKEVMTNNTGIDLELLALAEEGVRSTFMAGAVAGFQIILDRSPDVDQV